MRALEHQSVCSRRLSADFRRIASSLLLRIPQYPSSSLLALLGTRRKYSVHKLIGALAALEMNLRHQAIERVHAFLDRDVARRRKRARGRVLLLVLAHG